MPSDARVTLWAHPACDPRARSVAMLGTPEQWPRCYVCGEPTVGLVVEPPDAKNPRPLRDHREQSGAGALQEGRPGGGSARYAVRRSIVVYGY